MGIMKYFFVVVYNYVCDCDFGVLVEVEGISSFWRIKELCKIIDNLY